MGLLMASVSRPLAVRCDEAAAKATAVDADAEEVAGNAPTEEAAAVEAAAEPPNEEAAAGSAVDDSEEALGEAPTEHTADLAAVPSFPVWSTVQQVRGDEAAEQEFDAKWAAMGVVGEELEDFKASLGLFGWPGLGAVALARAKAERQYPGASW
mmetsp:Transcript_148590/g.475753  ORF Transcript_148590/g.475753 Transcript_148590/m.475753 type:complete len:154 (+) Transcript_148590:165-626(+)